MAEPKASTRELLARALLEAPGDGLARGALADWLEEHGEAGHELLRGQGSLVRRDDWKTASVCWRAASGAGEVLLWSGPGGRLPCESCGGRPLRAPGGDGVTAAHVPARGWLCPLCAAGRGPRSQSPPTL